MSTELPITESTSSCGCHDHSDDAPALDVRTIPHAIRHATVFGALDSRTAPGAAMVLIAHHDPLPLLAQIDVRYEGAFEVEYLERGPEQWRLCFTRKS